MAAKVRDYAPNAQNGAVTVTLVENPRTPLSTEGRMKCDYCSAPAEFVVSYYPK